MEQANLLEPADTGTGDHTDRRSTTLRVAALQACNQDFEWYPTTDEILGNVAASIRHHHRSGSVSIMDIGAGDGRVLSKLTTFLREKDSWRSVHVEPFAIEKAGIHLANMPKDIAILGTEFHEQTLVDKNMDVIFSNPPYSEYEAWSGRIIKESAAEHVYLVIPRRWRDSDRISQVIASRGAEVESLGVFDFENADR